MTNVKFYGDNALVKGEIMVSRDFKEAVRIDDSSDEEQNQAKEKLKQNFELRDAEADNAFRKGEVTSSMTKCANGENPCGLRLAMMSNNSFQVSTLGVVAQKRGITPLSAKLRSKQERILRKNYCWRCKKQNQATQAVKKCFPSWRTLLVILTVMVVKSMKPIKGSLASDSHAVDVQLNHGVDQVLVTGSITS